MAKATKEKDQEVTSTEASATEDTGVQGLSFNIGNEPPKEMFTRKGGAGRTRQPTIFDDAIHDLYEQGVKGNWADVATVNDDGTFNEELADEVEKQIRRCVQFFGYGLELRTNTANTDYTIGVWFKVGDKSNRGRPKGVKKNPATGQFEMPIGENEDGSPIFAEVTDGEGNAPE